MRTSILICLALLAASAIAVENKCDHHKDTAVKIATFLDLSKTEEVYNNKLFARLVKNEDTDTDIDTTSVSEISAIKKRFSGFGNKGCLKTKEEADGMKSAITGYQNKIKKAASLPQRVLAILPDMIKSSDGCGKASGKDSIQSIRVFAKTHEGGQKTINDIYKYEIKAKSVMTRAFRHILTAVVAAQGTANEFKVKKADFETVINAQQDNFKSLLAMRSKIGSLAKAYLKANGAAKCNDSETKDKFWPKLASDLTAHYQVYCQDEAAAEGDSDDAKEAKKGAGKCDKASKFVASELNGMWCDNGDKWKGIAGNDSKDDKIEDDARRVLSDTGNLESTGDDTGTAMVDAEPEDKFTIGGVDSEGNCNSDTTKCALPVTSTTGTTDGEVSVSVTSTESSSFMTFGFGFLALLIGAINAL